MQLVCVPLSPHDGYIDGTLKQGDSYERDGLVKLSDANLKQRIREYGCNFSNIPE